MNTVIITPKSTSPFPLQTDQALIELEAILQDFLNHEASVELRRRNEVRDAILFVRGLRTRLQPERFLAGLFCESCKDPLADVVCSSCGSHQWGLFDKLSARLQSPTAD